MMRIFDWTVKALVSVVFLVLIWIYRSIDLGAIWQLIANTRISWFLLAFLVLVIAVALAILKWVWLLRAQGIDLPFAHVLRHYMVCYFFNVVLIAGLGEAKRVYDVARDSGHTMGALMSVVVERFTGVLAFLIVILATLIPAATLQPVLWTLVPPVAVALIAALAIFFGSERLLRWKVFEKIAWIHTRLEKLEQAIAAYRQVPKVMWGSMLVSLPIPLLWVLSFYFIGLSLGVSIPFTTYLYFVPTISVLALLPISWKGIGPQDTAFIYFWHPLGVPDAAALAISFLSHFLSFGMGMLGAPFYYLTREPESTRPSGSGITGVF